MKCSVPATLLSFVYELPYLWGEKEPESLPKKAGDIHASSGNADRFIEIAAVIFDAVGNCNLW